MRRHGAEAKRRAAEISAIVEESAWSLRVLREARNGAIVVAGFLGEVLRVEFVAIDKSFAVAAHCCLTVPPEILARTGARWVQEDLKIPVDAPSSVEGHVARDSSSPAATGQGTSTNLPRKAKATGDVRRN